MNTLANLHGILPILIVTVTGMIVLLGDACIPAWRRQRTLSALISLLGVVAATLFSVRLMGEDNPVALFNGAVTGDAFAQASNVVLLVAAGIAILLAMTYLENRELNLGEYYALVLFSTSGGMLMAGATDLIVLFIALETLSVALYVLAGFARTEARSEEAALKYFLLGAFAAGFLLYGIALIYGGSAAPGHGGTTNLDALAGFLQQAGAPSVMLMTGVALLLVGLAFKAALVPFHMWTPDVYEGAPTSVTAFMASVAKIGAFAAILRVFNALLPIAPYWLTAIQVLAVLTMFLGNIWAVTQNNVKRMLAYSSIAHAGYLLVAVSAMAGANPAAHSAAFGAAIFYLLAYALMTMGAFAVLIWLSRRGFDAETLDDLKGLARRDAPSAYLMLIFMLSLGGIPPTMGFMGKWFIFYAALLAGQMWLAILLALASVISIYYYLRVVWMMCFSEPDTETAAGHARSAGGVTVSLLATGVGSLLFGIVPNLIQALMQAASSLARP